MRTYTIRLGQIVTMWTDLKRVCEHRNINPDLTDEETRIVAPNKAAALELVRTRLGEVYGKKFPASVFSDDSLCVGFILEDMTQKNIARGSISITGPTEARLNIYNQRR